MQVVAVGVEAVAVFREQNGSGQPADSEQQVGQTEQEQRLQLQTHTVMMQFKLLQIFLTEKDVDVVFSGWKLLEMRNEINVDDFSK